MAVQEAQCVRVTTTGSDAGGETISLSTRGWLEDTRTGWLLRYGEEDPSDQSAMETLVLCEADRVTVTRIGAMPNTMVFCKGETFLGEYATPLGSLQMRIVATEVRIRRRGGVGHVRLSYQVSLRGALSSGEEADMRHLDISFVPCRR